MKLWFLAAAVALSNVHAENMNSSDKTAVIGGGCFWCTEAMYAEVPGIKSVVSGYAGGTTPNPTYEEVCTGRTGHAEVVQITYDPAKISYEKIIDLFWKAHDPTTLNRQGADSGTQYRSIILYQTPEERAIAEKSMAAAQKDFRDPIVTEIKAPRRLLSRGEAPPGFLQKQSRVSLQRGRHRAEAGKIPRIAGQALILRVTCVHAR